MPINYFNGEVQEVRPNDVALSADGQRVYTSGDDGVLRIYDAQTGVLLSELDIGLRLGGMDVSPDGSFLLVVDLDPLESIVSESWPESSATVALYRVDLQTLEVTTYTFEMSAEQRAFYDVAVMADGQAIISQQIFDGWSGWAPIWSLDLATGEISSHGSYRDGSPLWDTTDGSVALLANDDISDAGLYTFNGAGTELNSHDLYEDGVSGFNIGVQAISVEAGLIVQCLNAGQIYIYNSALQLRFPLSSVYDGLAGHQITGVDFSADGESLFFLDIDADQIVELSTSDWSVLSTTPIGQDLATLGGGFGNHLSVSPDNRYFLVITDSGLVQVDNYGEPITGTAGDDEIHGPDHVAVLEGLEGNDLLFGGSDDDRLDGGPGNDLLDGGGGYDLASYASASTGVRVDLSIAASQNTVGAGIDTLLSIEGLIGSDFADVLRGGAGADTLRGGQGNDYLVGNAGNDTLEGGAGVDRLIGGGGNDSYHVVDATDYIYENAGEGIDHVFSTVTHALRDNVENLTLTGSAHTIGTGNGENNVITGNGGANRLYGMDGDDRIHGGAGNDRIEGGAGIDRLFGGAGNDVYAINDSTDYVYEYAGEGIDTVYSSVNHQLRENVERLYLTGTQALNGTGNSGANIINGNTAANILSGGGGNDSLYGQAGNDRLDGGTGVDRLIGGEGNDVYYVNDTSSYVYEAIGEGDDTVVASVNHALRDNIERLYLVGSDPIDGAGNGSANLIVGNGAANVLRGGGGNDTLQGNGGNDIVSGDSGNDWLEGGSGQDRFYGGIGADRFAFRDGDFSGTALSTADRIHDFSKVEGDRIHLDFVDADTIADGVQDFTFIASAGFSGTAGELRYEQVGGNTHVLGDTDGDGTADFMILLDGLHNLDVGDLIL